MTEKESRREEEVDLLDLLLVLAKRKKLILGITFGACAISVIVALLLPHIYRAETKILPPQQGMTSRAAQLLSQLGPLAGMAGATLNIKTPNDLYIGMLESRTVLDKIVDRFDLMKVYGEEYREDARKRLKKVFEAESDNRSGIISVFVEDKDPERSARMANAFVEELKDLVSGLAVTEAAQRRLFFEEQLKETKESLAEAEEKIKGFQEKTGALQIDAQAKAMIEGIADLRAQIASREVQLKVLQSYSTRRNPDLQKVEEELRGLKAELVKLEARGGGGYDPLMPTGRMPEVGTEYIRKLRDVKYYETLFELFAKLFESAKMDEARDTTIIQVVDPAVPPERKVKPRRRLIVIASTFFGFLLSAFIAFIKEYQQNISPDSNRHVKLEAIKKHVSFR